MSEAKNAAPQLTTLSICKSLFAGGFAGGLSRTAVAPLERLKIVMQVQSASGQAAKYTGIWQGLKHMAQTEGLHGLFKGNGTNCVRIVPNSAVKFFMYENFSRQYLAYLQKSNPDAQLSPLDRLGAGALSGIFAMSATYPLDMVRGRLTVQEGAASQYNGIVHAARSIIGKEGPLALYKGWVPSVIGVVPYVGLNFAVYESLKAELIGFYGCNSEQELSVVTRLGCGAVAGSVGQTVAYPFDVMRRRLQVTGWEGMKGLESEQSRAYTGMVDCGVRIVREEGVAALFKGLAPNYLKVVPSIAIAFVSYEQVKALLGVEFKISE